MATLAPVIPLQRNTTPDPCEIIAALMAGSGITPDRAERATAHLAEVEPAAAKFQAGILSAYWRMTATAS